MRVQLWDRPGAWEIALQGERIASVTPSAGEALGLALPAFVESHAHLFAGGVALGQLNLSAVHSEAELRAVLLPFAATVPEGEMVCCFGANYDLMGGRPTRAALDAVLQRPLYIVATDYHCAWANSAALQGVPEAPGVDLALGELHEFAAMDLVGRKAPSGGRQSLGLLAAEPETPDPERDKALIRAAMAECLRHGITRVVNMDGNLYQAQLFTELAEEGLPIDVSLPMTLVAGMEPDRLDALFAAARRPPVGRLSFGRVKMFMDGVFDTHTAYRVTDYPDRPGFRSEPLIGAEFVELCIRADALGLQIATHAVGDAAVRATLDGYEAARIANGARDSRHRVEHIDLLHPDDLPRFKALGVTASMQPVHPPGLAGLPLEPTISIVGADRWPDSFPWRALHGQTRLCFGTDWPVSPLSPLHAIRCAMTRQPWAPGNPDQRLTLTQALQAYTTTGAWADFVDHALEPGALADIVILSGDPSDPATRVLETYSRGVRSAFIA
ncbi:amidohydrolase [Stagnihabitans tardus]|uniref:Amidohydrolase family protein n=1 Tax=Stagnihabitans tardus TaxID=2699202 RepID=A0AAE4Y8G1_9RHOB|nr:amidohydrolase family protein [Stagnihabitans tardus]NBZ86861.1 amidohydrolase family protein [Stagnihabitans tardus]